MGGGRGSEGLEHLSFICALLTKEWSAEVLLLLLFLIVDFDFAFHFISIFLNFFFFFFFILAISPRFRWPLFLSPHSLLHYFLPLIQYIQKIGYQTT